MNRAERALHFARSHIGRDSKILDVGCGFGETLRLFKDAGYTNVRGVDPSAESIRKARAAHPDLDLAVMEHKLPSSDAVYDAVLLLDVLEHVDDETWTLREIVRVLKPGGLLVLSVPHAGYTAFLDPANMHRLITPSIPLHRHYSAQQLRALLEPEFSVAHIETRGLGLSQIAWMCSYPFRKLGFAAPTNKLVQRVGEWDYEHERGQFAYHIMIAARKQ